MVLTEFATVRVEFHDTPHAFDTGMPKTAHTEQTHAVIVGRATFRSHGLYWNEMRGLRVSTKRGQQEQKRLSERTGGINA